MSLDQIICLLNADNIKDLSNMLLSSRCEKAKKLLFLINNGENFYHSLGKIYGKMAHHILLSRNIYAIELLGVYLKINNKIFYKLIKEIFYPIIIFVLQFCLLWVLRDIIHIDKKLVFLLMLSIILIGYLFHHIIQTDQKRVIGLYLLIQLSENKISYCHFIECLKILKLPSLLQLQASDINQISKYHLNCLFVCSKTMLKYYKKKLKQLYRKIDQIPMIMKSLMIFFSVILCLVVLYQYYCFISSMVFNW